MKRFFFLLFFIVLLSMNFSCFQSTSNNSVVEVVSAEEMQEITQLEDVQLVDVRSANKYESGFIANAQNIDYLSPTFDEEIEKLDKSKPVVVYCEKGGRSAKCVEKMKDAGFIKIYELDGGIAKWKFKGYEVEETTP
ncbi:rhodanese-like domain-containing protein [Flavobacteriaceae bacterium AU392]|nr:rhodanese-like domain-containing protein [Flavobacteriaceae bacterium]RKM82749.1 rhodanese-like domain-containing protein [Flavobacteriaceae bacterium AU392]